MKISIRDLALELNRDYKDDRQKYNYLYDKYTQKTGPLGSRGKRVPICINEISEEISAPNSNLASQWKEGRVNLIISKMDMPTGAYRISPPDVDIYPNILLPGEKCARRAQE